MDVTMETAKEISELMQDIHNRTDKCEYLIISHLNENSQGEEKKLYDYFMKAKPINTIAGRGGIVTFRRNIRASVRGLWSGAITRGQALRTFNAAIERAIEAAWVEGAAECGIQPDELTVEELTARDEFIFNQGDYLPDFIAAIEAQSKANGGQLTPLLQRAEMWVNQYNSAKQQSEAMACANEKRVWVLGATEHCSTCRALAGQVRRLAFWQNNVMPRNGPNSKLECQGFRCQCSLEKTDRPISRGKLPRLAS